MLRRHFDERLEEDVVVPMFVQTCLAGERVAHVHDGRQFVEIDLHRGGQVFRFGATCCDADSDRLADMAHRVTRQHRLRRRLEAGQARDRYDRLHANQVLRHEYRSLGTGWLADGADAGVRDRAADEREIAHAGQANVGNELALAAQVPVILQSWNSGADALVAHRSPRGVPLHP